MIGVSFLEGNLDVSKRLAAKVHLIEPVLEGTMQLFFQFVILYIIYGPGTTNVQSRQTSDVRYTGCFIWKSWIQPSVLETFYDILKLSLVLNHPIGWEHWLLGKKIDIPAQFDYHEWVFWSLLFLWNLRFDWFSVFLKSSFLFQMRINDQI